MHNNVFNSKGTGVINMNMVVLVLQEVNKVNIPRPVKMLLCMLVQECAMRPSAVWINHNGFILIMTHSSVGEIVFRCPVHHDQPSLWNSLTWCMQNTQPPACEQKLTHCPTLVNVEIPDLPLLLCFPNSLLYCRAVGQLLKPAWGELSLRACPLEPQWPNHFHVRDRVFLQSFMSSFPFWTENTKSCQLKISSSRW